MDINGLVVDDSKVMRIMVMKTLRQARIANFSFEEAQNGAEAVEMVNDGDFEIVFMDINMPEMNGIEALEKIRSGENNADVPIVMITSEKTTEKIDAVMGESGANGYICKPFTVEQIEEKVGSVLEQMDED